MYIFHAFFCITTLDNKMNIDLALEKVGKWGRYQTLLYTIIFFAGIPNAFITIYYAISHHDIPHHCKLPGDIANLTTNATLLNFRSTEESEFNYTIPLELDQRGNMRKSQCYMKKTSYNALSTDGMFNHVNQSQYLIPCPNGWDFDSPPGETSPITEFNFVCEDDWKSPLAVSLYQIGLMTGSVMGAVADWFGRRPVFLLASLGQVVAMGLTSISWNYYAYLACVFFSGIFSLLNYVSAFIVGTEMIAPEWRNFLSIASFYSFSVGYAMVPALAYLLPNWRTYYWVSMLLSLVIYLPNYWLFPESPRWLATKGRISDSLKELKKISKMNRLDVDFSQMMNDEDLELKPLKNEKKTDTDIKPRRTLRNSLWILFRSPIKGRCITLIFGWIVTCTVYFAISLHLTSFSKNKYLNCFFAALSEFPSYVIAYYLVNVFGRPRSAMTFMFICGFSCIALPFIPEDSSVVLTVVSMLGKGGISAVFYVYYLLATEVVPTQQRSTNMSISSSIGRIGSFCAPYLVYAGKLHYTIPVLPMGILAIICGILTVMFIPETAGVEMPDSLEEAMSNDRFYRLNIFRKNLKPRRTKKNIAKSLSTIKASP